jgi:hypothetical protein
VWGDLDFSNRAGCPPPGVAVAVAITTAGSVVRVGRDPWHCRSCRDCTAGSWQEGSQDGPARYGHGGCGGRRAGSCRIRSSNSGGGVVRCRTTRTAIHHVQARRDAATAMLPSSPLPMPGSTAAPAPGCRPRARADQSSTCDHARLDCDGGGGDDNESENHTHQRSATGGGGSAEGRRSGDQPWCIRSDRNPAPPT